MLEEILDYRYQQLIEEKKVQPQEELIAKIKLLPPTQSFAKALEKVDFSIIAEIKKASPSAGEINNQLDVLKMASIYENAGAGAISVLTETRYFHGELNLIPSIKESISIPLLRKDFIIDQYQLYQSRVYRADVVLLIAAVLGSRLSDFLLLAHEIGLEALVEVHDEEELEVALKCDAKIIGINNRNLKTMKTDVSRTEQLAPQIPPEILLISESGIKERKDVERVIKAGGRAVLVGESLVRSTDPGLKIKELLGRCNHGS